MSKLGNLTFQAVLSTSSSNANSLKKYLASLAFALLTSQITVQHLSGAKRISSYHSREIQCVPTSFVLNVLKQFSIFMPCRAMTHSTQLLCAPEAQRLRITSRCASSPNYVNINQQLKLFGTHCSCQ